MNNRLKMLEVSLDDSESDPQSQPQPQPQSQPTPALFKLSKGTDKFESRTVTKGMFMGEDEEIDYHFIPIVPLKRQPPPQRKKSKPTMKILNEINYDSFEAEIQSHEVQNKQHSQDQTFKKRAEGGEEQQGEENIKTTVFSKMLEIALSDQSSSEGKEEERQQQLQSDQESQNLNPTTTKINYQQIVKAFSSHSEFSRNFSLSPVPNNKFIHLFISRNSFGLNKIWPEFSILFAESNYSLLSAKKMMGSTTSNFYMTTEPGIEEVQHLNFLAKMRANQSGSVYHVFDRGVSPTKAGKFYKTRSIQATIRFKSQEECNEPRQFQVFTLNEGVAYQQLAGAVPKQQIGLDILYFNHPNSDRISLFKNRKPIFSEALKGYILNFSGRVQQPSVKNFILQDPETRREVLMLGKTSDDLFRLDVSHPFSPCLAVCVALSNFDSRFLNE